MPERIQRKRALGWRMPDNTICVSRPSRYGNPFVIGKKFRNLALYVCLVGVLSQVEIDQWYATGGLDIPSADVAVEWFERYAAWRLGIEPNWLELLRGKNLACWCKGEPCHADVILRLANNGVQLTGQSAPRN